MRTWKRKPLPVYTSAARIPRVRPSASSTRRMPATWASDPTRRRRSAGSKSRPKRRMVMIEAPGGLEALDADGEGPGRVVDEERLDVSLAQAAGPESGHERSKSAVYGR